MSETVKQKKLYIASIQWKTHSKRIFFEGIETAEAAVAFEESTRDIGRFAETASSWESLLSEARELYGKAGFVEIYP